MIKHLNLLAHITVLSMAVGSSLIAQTSGQTPAGWSTVTERVLDSEGRPVAGAGVSVFPMDVAASGAVPRRPISDEEGRYRLVSPAYPGRTRLCAVKESAGYPDTQGLLFVSGTETMPEVYLTPGGHLEDVDIRLGPPDGTLEGFVVDNGTGAWVPKARITLHRADREAMYSTSLPPDGHFLFALPPAPIEIKVSAPGYLIWKYKDPRSGAAKVVLDTLDRRTITVELTPK
jgi:hypothetical protein